MFTKIVEVVDLAVLVLGETLQREGEALANAMRRAVEVKCEPWSRTAVLCAVSRSASADRSSLPTPTPSPCSTAARAAGDVTAFAQYQQTANTSVPTLTYLLEVIQVILRAARI